MEPNLLDKMLNAFITEQKTVTVTLQNKVRVSGKVKSFDNYVLVLDGQRREIIYRHAISSLSASSAEETKHPEATQRPVQAAPRRKTGSPERPRTSSSTPSSSARETSINNSMKEGLLKWMQERKAAK